MSYPLTPTRMPEGLAPWKLKQVARLRTMLTYESYVDADGALRWQSNDSVIGTDTFSDAFAVPPTAQAEARERYLDATLRQYRAARKNYTPSAEELFEMRAAFGTGGKVVDVITGQEFQL